MDPDACLSEMLEAIATNEQEEAYEHAEDLITWLDRGGFSPGGGKLRANSIREFCNWVRTNYQKEP